MTPAHRPKRIISGGQTGADQGALTAAKQLGIATGGAAPQGWLTESGPQEQLLRTFGLQECDEPGYEVRTRKNVFDSDGTLLVGPHNHGGSALTEAIAREKGKPVFHAAFVEAAEPSANDECTREFRCWLEQHAIDVLNVAGNRESHSPGIQAFTHAFLLAALQ
jgi:hypothetical protein